MPLGVTLSSLIHNLKSGTSIDIFILSLAISAKTIDRLRRVISRSDINLTITFIEVDPTMLEGLKEVGHLSIAAYLRIFLPVLLPPECAKVLYLDCDLLVFDDVSDLWNTDVGSNYLLAALSPTIHSVSHENGLYNWKDLGLDQNALYFNSGVLLINLKKWREDDLYNKLFRYALEHVGHLRWADQDVINAVCAGSWGLLHPKWNAVNTIMFTLEPSQLSSYFMNDYDQITNRPAITHFASSTMKPWRPEGSWVPFRRKWFDALHDSGWFTTTQYYRWESSYWYRKCIMSFGSRIERLRRKIRA